MAKQKNIQIFFCLALLQNLKTIVLPFISKVNLKRQPKIETSFFRGDNNKSNFLSRSVESD